MTKVYAVDVLLVATAYIRASSPEEAAAKASEAFAYPTEANVSRGTIFGEVEVSDVRTDSPDLPELSLSPALTFQGAATNMGEPRPFNPATIEEA